MRPLDYKGPFAEDVYRERTHGGSRTFTLSGDRLIIQGRRTLQGGFTIPVSLRVVDPEYGVSRRGSDIAGPGALFLGLLFGLIGLFGVLQAHIPLVGAMIDGILCALCLWTGIRNLPKAEYYSFQGRGGGIVFDIARSGPDRKRFDSFVRRVVERARAVQAEAAAESH